MKELDAIIQEQVWLLETYGYSETGLNNGEAPRSVRLHLKQAVQAVLENKASSIIPTSFELYLFGQFNNDTVLYTFRYEYDPLYHQINLLELEARLDNVPLTIRIEQGTDLWKPWPLYDRVKTLSQPVQAALEQQEDNQIQALIDRELALLQKSGYTDKKLAGALNNAVSKARASQGDDALDFILAGKWKTSNFVLPLRYRLHYIYKPEARKLIFKSLHGRVGKAVNTFFGVKNFPIPPADAIHEYLTARHTALTKTIMPTPSSNTSQHQKR